MKLNRFILSCLLSLLFINVTLAENGTVSVTVFKKIFPTYKLGPDDPNPYFKDFRIPGMNYFRGARSVYPYTFQNDYRQEKEDIEYEVVRLENDFIYVDIIPQLRGRIQGAVDKRNNWDFLYYNHVIKPAEIAVRSAWISGGLEYNHPGGHGYTQFNKISYDIIDQEDGSKTIVVAEIEPVRMMKWEFEITLHPMKMYVETKGRFISIVPYRVPFVSSNNAAMHVTDEMELIYPQDTYASGHGFGGLKKWSEFSPDNKDWNWVKNIKRALSAFVDGSGLLMDYWGTYSHDAGIDAGTVVIADHRVAPGKKYFTWGTHESGKQWDHFLSDEDGGYVELQQQAYFSNLGYGYAVLEPFEVKEFSIYWYPIKNTGGFVKASKELAVNFKRVNSEKIRLDIQPTQNLPATQFAVYINEELVSTFEIDLEAGEVYNRGLDIKSSETDTLALKIHAHNGRELLSYASHIKTEEPEINRIPKKNISEYSIDELYFKAISDYHDPYGPEAEKYIMEIFKLDSMESRANRLLGTIFIKRGQYWDAIKYLKRSLVNDHFEDCYRTWFLLGYGYIQLDHLDKAHECLVQASRHKSELDNSLFYLAQVQIIKKNFHEALRILKQVPISKLTHPDIYNLISYTYRKLGQKEMAAQYIQQAFKIDPLNFVGYIERLELAAQDEGLVEKINFIFDRNDDIFVGSQNYIETAIFYMDLKDYASALRVLNIAEKNYKNSSRTYPFVNYYIGYCLIQLGQQEEALDYYRKASETDQTFVFPYRQTSIRVLESVIAHVPNDAAAKMYFGDLMYYLRRPEQAVTSWEESYDLSPDNFRVIRNLAISHFVKNGDLDYTIKLMEESFEKSGKNIRIFAELENLYIHKGNFTKLEKHYDINQDILKLKGDYALNAADFYVQRERFEDAKQVLKNTYFSAAENALGKPVRHTRYVEAYVGTGIEFLSQKNYERAIEEFKLTYMYPDYLNEVKVNYPVTARQDYYLALAYKMNHQKDKAKEYFDKAINQEVNLVSVAAIYKAKALKETYKKREAEKMVQDMLDRLEAMDQKSADAMNLYLRSLAYDFFGKTEEAKKLMKMAKAKDYNVVMQALYESSYITERQFALE